MTISKTIQMAAIFLAGTILAPVAMAGGQSHESYLPDLLPYNPKTGECYARIEVPAQYATGSQQVLVADGYSKLEVDQPRLLPRQENVMIKEASVRYQVRQPSFRSVSEQMMVRPAYDKLSVSAPQFSTITETLQTSAPRLVWKRGNPGKLASQGYRIHSTANGGRYTQGTSEFRGATECGATCEIWCLVEEPGEQVHFNRKVMTAPGQVQRHHVPAKYQTIHKQVVSDPGGVEEIPVPAQFRSVTVEDVVDPGGERMTHIPPKYASVATKQLLEPSRYEWRRVVCAPKTGSIASGSTYSSGSGSVSGDYTSPQSSTATIVPNSRIVTGTGYYGSESHGQKAKRKRKTWY